tara:strand:+ start:364 stop:1116 length:753 start_codon:yes stop_codon:yes gene_type:complete
MSTFLRGGDLPLLDIARGKVRNTTIRNIFGLASNMTLGSFKACWENDVDYVYLASAETLDVVSDSTSDTAVSVKLIGVDTDYVEVEEVVALTGTTPVTTTNSFLRVNDLLTISGNAVGDVTVTGTVSTGTTVAKMIAGTGRNQASIYTVPAGCSFYLTRINAFSSEATGAPSSKVGAFKNFVRLSSGVELRVAETDYEARMEIIRIAPFKYSEKTDIQLQSKTFSTHSTSIFAEGILIKDNEFNVWSDGY